MKKSKLVLLLCVCFALTACFAVGCSDKSSAGGGNIENLQLLGTGVLTWDEVKGATYEISADGQTYSETESNEADLLALVKSEDVNKIYVRAKSGNKVTHTAEFELSVAKLAAPEKPVVRVNEETKIEEIVWSAVTSANRYLVRVNNGDHWIVYTRTAYTPTSSGTYTLQVKCRGYAANGVLYLESEPSPVSETLEFLQGPALSVTEVNVIAWESADEFDSCNLWIDGKKVRENVTSPLNLVTGDNPVLTATGEYDVQIEAIKGGKSVFSNLQEEVGTSNINEKEMFSFDNRIFKPVVAKPGMRVTNEQKHGESGYSLFIEIPDQVNMERYVASGINDVDFRRINRISYWAYVPEISGYAGDTVQGTCLPPVVYDGWTSVDTPAAHTRTVAFANEETVPVGEWTKVTFDCENQYPNVLILGKGAEMTLDDGITNVTLPVYIDDICYETVDDVTDYDYKLFYGIQNAGGAWMSPAQKIALGSQYAGKTVAVSLQIAGTAKPDGTNTIGFTVFEQDASGNFATGNVGGYKGIGVPGIDRALLSSLEYSEYTAHWKLDSEGNYLLSAGMFPPKGQSALVDALGDAYSIYVKDVTVTETYDPTGAEYVLPYFGGEWYTLYDKSVEVDLGLQYADKTVELSMKVCGTADAKWQNTDKLGIHTYAWNGSKYEFAAPNYLSVDKISGTDAWADVDWTVSLDENGKFRMGAMYFAEGGVAYDIYVKDITVRAAYFSRGTKHKDNSYHQSYYVIPSSLPAGSAVNITMDIKFGENNDENSALAACSLEKFAWGNADAAFVDGMSKRTDLIAPENNIRLVDYASREWQTVTFTATVYAYGTVQANGSFEALDMSGYGNCVLMCLYNATSAESPASVRNISVTAVQA